MPTSRKRRNMTTSLSIWIFKVFFMMFVSHEFACSFAVHIALLLSIASVYVLISITDASYMTESCSHLPTCQIVPLIAKF